MIGCYEKEQAALKDYSAKIKKAVNMQNIKNVGEEIGKCAENIAYLKKWPQKRYEPLPVLDEEKVQKYNMDANDVEPNEVEVNIVDAEGVDKNTVIRIYIASEQQPRY
jgi:hypothetical protein